MMALCDRAEDYFAGVLVGKARERFQEHLISCARCRKRLRELRVLDRALRKALAMDAPPSCGASN